VPLYRRFRRTHHDDDLQQRLNFPSSPVRGRMLPAKIAHPGDLEKGVNVEWRLDKGFDRLFLSSGSGYDHEVTLLGQTLISFWASFDRSGFAGVRAPRHGIGRDGEQEIFEALIGLTRPHRKQRSKRP